MEVAEVEEATAEVGGDVGVVEGEGGGEVAEGFSVAEEK